MSLEKIKNYFVNISEDKFTKVKTIDCKFEIELSLRSCMQKDLVLKDSPVSTIMSSSHYVILYLKQN